MRLASLEAIVAALNSENVRYLVAGGLAVNAHGYIRYTQDVDLVIALDPENILRAFSAFAALGYKPLVPITAEQFANAELRRQWIRDKGMKVLNFFSDLHRETNIDVFVAEPFDFEREYANALQGELAPALSVRFVYSTCDGFWRNIGAMDEAERDIDWSLTTWEGNRRAQLRRALALTLRQRLEAAEGLADVARRFEEMRAKGKFASVSDGAARRHASSSVHEPSPPYDADK